MLHQVHLSTSNRLKGLAILAVVGLHLLTLFDVEIYYQKNFETQLIVILDQFWRFSVPLFFALSGYGLSQKYKENDVSPLSFYKSRMLKLLPLFVLWSSYLWVLPHLLPGWPAFKPDANAIDIFMYGKADYHLYFMYVLLQFYLLFPLLQKVKGKLFIGLTFTLTVLQLALFSFTLTDTDNTYLYSNDQRQYRLLLSWASYFLIGMLLGRKKISITPLPLIFTSLIGLVISIKEALTVLSNNQSVIEALRFTRVSIWMYAFSMVVLVLTSPYLLRKVNLPPARSILLTLGTWSFLIYLSHTTYIKIIKFWMDEVVHPTTLVLAGLLTILVTLISVSITRPTLFKTALKKLTL